MKEIGIILAVILGMYFFKDYHLTKIAFLFLGFVALSR